MTLAQSQAMLQRAAEYYAQSRKVYRRNTIIVAAGVTGQLCLVALWAWLA